MRAIAARALAAVRAVDRVLGLPLRLLVALYRGLISPMLPPACRFYPSCSAYADEALARHGLVHGGALTARRLCRCHPFSEGGFDPVPGADSRLDDPSASAARPVHLSPTHLSPADLSFGPRAASPSTPQEDACARS